MLLVDPMHILWLRVLVKRTSNRLYSGVGQVTSPLLAGGSARPFVSLIWGHRSGNGERGGAGEVGHFEGRRGAELISTVSLAWLQGREVLLAAHRVSGVVEISGG